MTSVEQEAINHVMRTYPQWSTIAMEEQIIRDIREILPTYHPRYPGAYRRWFNNNSARRSTGARVTLPPPPPIVEISNAEFFETTDDEEDDSEDDRLMATVIPRREPAPAPTRKRTFSACLSKEDLESEMDKLQAAYKRRKEELAKEETACPECPICCETIDKTFGMPAVLASCGHVFCAQCYMRTCSTPLARYTNTCYTCPMCRSNWDKPNKVHVMPQGATVADCKLKTRDANVVTIS